MSNAQRPTPAQRTQFLVEQQKTLSVQRLALAEQLADVDKRLAYVNAALQGVQLGQSLQQQLAEEEAARKRDAECKASLASPQPDPQPTPQPAQETP